MCEFFKSKKQNDFRNHRKFWDFYSAFIQIKSDKNGMLFPDSFVYENKQISGEADIGNVFNGYFTSLNSNSTCNQEESLNFIKSNFNSFFENNLSEKFVFKKVDTSTVKENFLNLSSTSGPGICNIESKIVKNLSDKFFFIICNLFNLCFTSNSIPTDWKTAVVTPLYKNKGARNDLNNYRGLSVLPPVAKVFEKIIASQIIVYISVNNILFFNQHGFRKHFSCETALHELFSNMFRIKSLRLIALFLFIDFRKAFDIVDSTLLLFKLSLYGFSDNVINFFKDYFSSRKQLVKINNTLSNKTDVYLGVPQGSVLGPLLFLLFINDLPFYLKKFKSVLFADDTTLFLENDNLPALLEEFQLAITDLMKWTNFNKIDINWSKTEIMFIFNKRNVLNKLPSSILINQTNHTIKVVNFFKILGITVDYELKFLKYVCDLRLAVNKRLYSIKRLFFLSYPVKLLFFKTFILPYFDYCSTLFIYFPKETIQKISNIYNFCLFKLFKFNFKILSIDDINLFNIYLEKWNLFTFQHRILSRFLNFSFKVINYNDFPFCLKSQLKFNYELNKGYELRNSKNLDVCSISKFNNYDERLFKVFFSKFINICGIDLFDLNFIHFKNFVENNINLIFLLFIKNFPQFDINYKYMYIST